MPACSALLLVTPLSASATPKVPTPKLVSDALAAPFNIAFKGYSPYVADGGLNQVVRVRRDGTLKPIVSDAPGTSGLAFSKDGRYLAYTTTEGGEGEPPGPITASGLNIKKRHKAPIYADTLAYEQANNPDQHVHYGVRKPPQCLKDALQAIRASYKGAGGFSRVLGRPVQEEVGGRRRGRQRPVVGDNRGKISTLAVLPSQPVKITAGERGRLRPARLRGRCGPTSSRRCRPTSRSAATATCTSPRCQAGRKIRVLAPAARSTE